MISKNYTKVVVSLIALSWCLYSHPRSAACDLLNLLKANNPTAMLLKATSIKTKTEQIKDDLGIPRSLLRKPHTRAPIGPAGTPIAQSDIAAAATGFDITAPGTYTVVEPLVADGANSTVIKISANNVTLDLGDFTIDGTGTSNCISATARDQIVIQNGTVSNSLTNIFILGGSNHIISNIVSQDATSTGCFCDPTGLVIQNCSFINNGGNGLITGFSSDSDISSVIADGNFGVGIVSNEDSTVIRDCILRNNTGSGCLFNGTATAIRSNLFQTNNQSGLESSSGTKNLVLSNKSENNTGAGFRDDLTAPTNKNFFANNIALGNTPDYVLSAFGFFSDRPPAPLGSDFWFNT